MHTLKFDQLSLSKETMQAVKDMGFEEASPIQSLAIPEILAGKDVIGQAQTGTGKTAAFGIPLVEMIDPKRKTPQALVLCPTRELAIQVAEEVKKLSSHRHGVSIVPVFGGQPIERQFQALRKGAQIIIGTPGRIMDHLERRTLDLRSVRMVVLDEADEMLDMGFRDDIELILRNVPVERQTVFFSATMPRPFLELTKKFQKNPMIVRVAHEKLTVPRIEQVYVEVKEGMKLEVLCRVADLYAPKLSLVFCNTKRKVDEVVSHLQARGYAADGIHGDMNQSQRDRVMGRFRKGAFEMLVATDVAARGIDVDDIEVVFNYDVPYDEENYVHRIGRTGRAGRSGRACTFVAGKEIYKLRDIQRYAKITITRNNIPSEKDVEKARSAQFLDRIREVLQEGSYAERIPLLESFLDENTSSLDVAAALLHLMMQPATAAADAPAPRDRFGDTGAEQGYVRFFLNVGKVHDVRPGDIVGAIAGETGLPGSAIGRISIHERVSFVEVPEEAAEKVMSVMNKKMIKKHHLRVEPATPISSEDRRR